jgi:DNA polymerase III epsilon subunit family exonuclease
MNLPFPKLPSWDEIENGIGAIMPVSIKQKKSEKLEREEQEKEQLLAEIERLKKIILEQGDKNKSETISVNRKNKGKSLTKIPANYCIIDIETTGYTPAYCKIIELGALKIKNGNIIDKFQSFVNPKEKLSNNIISHTGITDEMVSNAPFINEILPQYLDFISIDIIIAHNANFDVNFIYDNSISIEKQFTNDFVDTVRIARKLWPYLPHHKLQDLKNYLNINIDTSHRALSDCYTLFEILKIMQKNF